MQKSLDDKWNKLQSDFDNALTKMVERIGTSMGLREKKLVSVSEGNECPTEIQKKLVLGMDLSLNVVARKLRGGAYKVRRGGSVR